MKYNIVIEKEANSYGAYVSELPGCVAVAESESKVVELIKDSIKLHVEDNGTNEDIQFVISISERSISTE